MKIIQSSFGLTNMNKTFEEKRKVILATAAVTSLDTYFMIKQLVQMSSVEDTDEIIGIPL